MPKWLEDQLAQEASAKGLKGKRASAYVYGTLQNIGALKGNVETPKGKAMTRKHNADHPARNLGKFLHPTRKAK